jgi:hypothetical protein
MTKFLIKESKTLPLMPAFNMGIIGARKEEILFHKIYKIYHTCCFPCKIIKKEK